MPEQEQYVKVCVQESVHAATGQKSRKMSWQSTRQQQYIVILLFGRRNFVPISSQTHFMRIRHRYLQETTRQNKNVCYYFT